MLHIHHAKDSERRFSVDPRSFRSLGTMVITKAVFSVKIIDKQILTNQLPRIKLSLQDLLFLLLEARMPYSQLYLHYLTYPQPGEDVICRVGRR